MRSGRIAVIAVMVCGSNRKAISYVYKCGDRRGLSSCAATLIFRGDWANYAVAVVGYSTVRSALCMEAERSAERSQLGHRGGCSGGQHACRPWSDDVTTTVVCFVFYFCTIKTNG
jgi:hypothetical protein